MYVISTYVCDDYKTNACNSAKILKRKACSEIKCLYNNLEKKSVLLAKRYFHGIRTHVKNDIFKWGMQAFQEMVKPCWQFHYLKSDAKSIITSILYFHNIKHGQYSRNSKVDTTVLNPPKLPIFIYTLL